MKNKPEGRSPYFPKRAVVTSGMPYGDKSLHFGHVGGNFIHSDIYARFLRDRIGPQNVIYVSGTDCYGSGPEVKFQSTGGEFASIEEFVAHNHTAQKKVLDAYDISLSLYAASGLDPAKDIHANLSAQVFNTWYDNGYLRLEETEQFFDEESQVFLNGRQVEGHCPIVGCKSETAYADECALGHQYSPKELINPKSIITGKTPALKPNKNWYFDLERFSDDLKKKQEQLKDEGISRRFLLSNVADFLKDPAILISKVDDMETLKNACAKMPSHVADINEEKKSATLIFNALKDREAACEILREVSIRFRTGTTLVPFRLTGNVKWGIPVPVKEGVEGQTFWVWPESLWAPMSFVQTYLESINSGENWRDWWFDPESRVYQFIGEDNIYFYAVAAMGLFMALNDVDGRGRQDCLPVIVPNRHVFFGNSKASSSGKLQPPAADELLNHYTAEQLRMHFGHMALQNNSVKFFPKAVFKQWQADGKQPDVGDIEGFDSTLAEGNLLTNVFNRLIRSCFYSLQQYFDGTLPDISVSEEANEMISNLIANHEWAMYRFEFSKAIDQLDKYLRDINKIFDARMKQAKAEDDAQLRTQTLVDAFNAVKVATVLLHPFASEGTSRVQEYLNIDDRLWDWTYINKPLSFFADGGHMFKFLEPRVDFFVKHPAQLAPQHTETKA